MNRRHAVAAGAMAAAADLLAQSAEPGESAYIPDHHRVNDRKVIHDFMDEFGFASVITAHPSIRITHIPVLLDREAGSWGRILGHVARANPQQRTFDGKHESLILFRGPHRYISPGWYATERAVPTWNFTAVHASGRAKLVEDNAKLAALLERLVAKYEAYEKSSYAFDKLPAAYKEGMMKNIVMFEMPVERVEAKFKLGLERSAADREGFLSGLEGAKPERGLLEFTKAEIKRRGA